MTRDEVISMAREAFIQPNGAHPVPVNVAKLEMFAFAVAEREREACAKLCEQIEDSGHEVNGYGCAAEIRSRTAQWGRRHG